MTCDAGAGGWGAVLEAKWIARGLFSHEESVESSTFREILALFMACIYFERWFVKHSIPNVWRVLQVWVDNEPLFYIMKWGSCKPHINEYAKKLWAWGERMRIKFQVCHMKREFNPWSDRLSKWGVGELVVMQAVVTWAGRVLGLMPEVQAFTSRSAVIPSLKKSYWCESEDPLALAVGFFRQSLTCIGASCTTYRFSCYGHRLFV